MDSIKYWGAAAGCPVPGRTDGRESDRGDHERSLPLVERVLGQLRLYRGNGGGGMGVGSDVQRRGNTRSATRNSNIIGEVAISYQDTPHPNPLPSNTSCTGLSGRDLKCREVWQAVIDDQLGIGKK